MQKQKNYRAFGKRILENQRQFKLKDWLISRQRYLGTPIPIVYDPEGNPHPVPDEHLPLELPDDVEYKPKGTYILGTSKELIERTEKILVKVGNLKLTLWILLYVLLGII